ncbi:autotransporter domain-containing protein [Phascolarctobacterium sp.]
MKGNFFILAVGLSLTSTANMSVWAANTGGKPDSPKAGDYAGKVVTEAAGAADNQSVEIDSNVTGNVYGGYISNSANEDNAGGNSVNIKDKVSIGGGLYGGYTSGTGAAEKNKLIISGDLTVTGGIIGGLGKTAAANVVEIGSSQTQSKISAHSISAGVGNSTESSVVNNVLSVVNVEFTKSGTYGAGLAENSSGEVAGNEASFSDVKFATSTVLYGGKNAKTSSENPGLGTGEVRNNTLNLKNVQIGRDPDNSAVVAYVTGGETSNALVRRNKVIIDGDSTLIDVLVMGGYISYPGGGFIPVDNEVSDNMVWIKDGVVTDDIAGGYAEGLAKANNNKVLIDGGHLKYSSDKTGNPIPCAVYGGIIAEAFESNRHTVSGNNVTVNNGKIDVEVMGGATLGLGNVEGNSVTINGGTINKNVYGGYAGIYSDDVYTGSTDKGDVTGNSVNIYNKPVFSDDVILYGGYSEDNKSKISNNSLNIYTTNISVGDIKNFDTYNFYLPESMTAGEAVLTLKNNSGLNLNGSSVNIGVTGAAPILQSGDKITLIKNSAVITADPGQVQYGKLQQGVSIVYDFRTELENGNKDLVTTIIGAPKGTTGQSKSPVETQAATIGFLNSGSDLLIDKGIFDAVRVAAVGEKNNPIFGAANTGKMRYKSGSQADVTGYNIVLGAARTVNNSSGQLTYGPFAEGGWGNYTTKLDSGIRGEGNTKYYGVGVFARQDNKNGIYYEGSVRYGRLEADYASGDLLGSGGDAVFASYDSSSAYYGAHFGVGKVSAVNERVKANVYAKLLYNHQNGDRAALGGEGNGEVYDFDAVDSLRARIGGRLSKEYGAGTTGYAGLAYEYEFDGETRASVKGFSTPSPSIKGSSGMFEVGYIWQPKAANDPAIDLGLQGWAGKKQGLTANINFVWKF